MAMQLQRPLLMISPPLRLAVRVWEGRPIQPLPLLSINLPPVPAPLHPPLGPSRGLFQTSKEEKDGAVTSARSFSTSTVYGSIVKTCQPTATLSLDQMAPWSR